MEDLGPAYHIGLLEWHVTTLTDGRRIALRQADGYARAVFESRAGGDAHYVIYNDVHGTYYTADGAASSLEGGMGACDNPEYAKPRYRRAPEWAAPGELRVWE